MKRPRDMFFRAADRHPLLLLTGAYILWALCYPPFILGPAAFIVLAPIFVITSRLGHKQAFFYNLLGGLVHNAIMYYWIYNVMKVGPPVVIGLGLMLLIFYFALFNGYLGFAFKFFQSSHTGLALFALFWAGFETARASGQMSFPWAHIGYTLGNSLSLIQITSVIGIYGLGLILAVSNLAVFHAWTSRNLKWLAAVPAALFLLWGFGAARLSGPALPSGVPEADISLVQPSIEQTRKWDEAYFSAVVDSTFALMDRHDLSGSDIIVLAETAIPAFLKQQPEVAQALAERALKNGSDLISGSLDFELTGRPGRPYNFYNSAYLFPGDSAQSVRKYVKLRLVPFSERLPFDDVFPVLNYVNLGEGDFSAGDSLMFWGGRFRYSPSICYEIVYPDFVRRTSEGGAAVMVNITNDAWFGRSTAPYQHANICRFRAVETGLPIARCANNGISVFFDPQGRILASTRLFETTVLRYRVPLVRASAPYLIIGDAVEGSFFWIWVLLNGWIGWGVVRRRRQPSP